MALLAFGAAPAVSNAATPDRWVPGWTGPPIGYEPKIRDALGRPFSNETVRQDVRIGVTGNRLRVRFTNELADTPLRAVGEQP